jgi:tetratricopeptide (TPR) repeat protein
MIAYEMLVGPEKFAEAFKDVLRDEKAQQVRWMHWHSNPTLRPPALRDLQPGVPPLVGKIIERMMDKDPSKRFTSADQIIRWLRRIFVMHVQGKSISATDSESMEKEIDAEAAAPAATAVVPAGRPGAPATAAGAVVPAAGQAPVEKTAPLPQPKWTWKQAALIAAIVLVTCGGVLAFFVIRERSQRLELERAADQRWMLGRQQFDDKQYDAAYKTLTRMAQDFAQLQNRASQALELAQRAKAEDALSRKDYEVADPACVAAGKLGAPALWVSDFRTRMLKYQDIDQVVKSAEVLQKEGKFEEAKRKLQDLQAKYPELKLTDIIIKLSEEIELGDLRRHVAEGKASFERGSMVAALTSFQAARKVRETPEVNEWIQKVTNRMTRDNLVALVEKAVAAAKWDEAARCYDEIYKLDPSPATREKANLARAEALAIQARALEQNGLSAQAAPIWDKVLGFNPKHAEAIQATQKRNRQQKIDGFMKAGNDCMAAKQWDQAINSFNDVKTLLDATDTALKTKIDGFVAECSYQKAMAAGRAALARDDFAEAERQAGIANGLKSTDEAKAFQARIDTRKQYKGFFDTAMELSKQFNYVQARSAALKAQKVEDTPEVRALIIDVDYYRYKAQGDMLQEQEKLIEALNFYRIAQRAKDTVEIQAKIDLLTKKIEAQKAKEPSTQE